MAKYTKEQTVEAITHLRKILKPGDTVYTLLRSVSRSGMSRTMDVYCIRKGELVYLTGWVAQALGMNRRDHHLQVSGCGMDMGFHVVYEIGRVLFPKGFKQPKGRHGRNGDTSGFDNDGGYALQQRWL